MERKKVLTIETRGIKLVCHGVFGGICDVAGGVVQPHLDLSADSVSIHLFQITTSDNV